MLQQHVLSLFEALVTFAALAITIAVAWRISTGGGGAAVTELSEANRVLERRIHDLRDEYQKKVEELGSEIRDLHIENAKLRTRTDYQAVIAEHETRANERHGATLKVLELIAARLGPEPSTL